MVEKKCKCHCHQGFGKDMACLVYGCKDPYICVHCAPENSQEKVEIKIIQQELDKFPRSADRSYDRGYSDGLKKILWLIKNTNPTPQPEKAENKCECHCHCKQPKSAYCKYEEHKIKKCKHCEINRAEIERDLHDILATYEIENCLIEMAIMRYLDPYIAYPKASESNKCKACNWSHDCEKEHPQFDVMHIKPPHTCIKNCVCHCHCESKSHPDYNKEKECSCDCSPQPESEGVEEEFFTLYDLRGPWAEKVNKEILLQFLNKRVKEVLQAQAQQIRREERERAVRILEKMHCSGCKNWRWTKGGDDMTLTEAQAKILKD